jgi:hypothetical protein
MPRCNKVTFRSFRRLRRSPWWRGTLERPQFVPMKDVLEYCVLIKWKTGAHSQVNYFACVQDAQRWVDRESENWFLTRGEELPNQQSIADRDSMTLRGPRIGHRRPRSSIERTFAGETTLNKSVNVRMHHEQNG